MSVSSSTSEPPECLTCRSPCLYSETHLSPSFTSYILHCLGPDIPYSQAFSLPNNTAVFLLDNNTAIRENVRHFSTPQVKMMTVALTNSDIPARVKLFLPPGFREYEDFVFPLVIKM